MYELPLFPLNTVLFPGMPLNLHIFEERYKLMMNQCIEQRSPFGVVLIANDVPDTSQSAQTRMVGCTAQITQVQPLTDGQMNIAAVGRERFQVVSLNYDKPYLSGMVESFPITDETSPAVAQRAKALRVYLERYLDILKQAGQLQFVSAQLPRDPASVTYLAAVLLQNATTEQKQDVLETENMATMVRELSQIYRREVALMEIMLSPPENNDYRGVYSLS